MQCLCKVRPTIRLGSLDFLTQTTRFTFQKAFKGNTERDIGFLTLDMQDDPHPTGQFELPLFDIVIMNPPFARSCGDNLLFGNLSKEERNILTAELKKMRKKIGTTGIGQAGQAADFIYLACKTTKRKGRLSLIVPKSFALVQVGKNCVISLVRNAEIECIFLNYEDPHYGFSESTQLSECMIIARNNKPICKEDSTKSSQTLIVNFEKSPVNQYESYFVHRKILDIFNTKFDSNCFNLLDYTKLGYETFGNLDRQPMGNAFFVPQKLLGEYIGNWGQIFPFFSPELCRIRLALSSAINLCFREKIHLALFPFL